MAITEQSVFDSINIRDSGYIELRRTDLVLRDGVVLGTPQYHRLTLVPGDDVSGFPASVQAAAAAAWTPESMTATTAVVVALAQAETVTRNAAIAEAQAATAAALQAKADAEAVQAAAALAQAEAETAQAAAAQAKAQADALIEAAAQAQAAAQAASTVDVLTDLQIRLALNQAGLREAVEAYVAVADQATKDWWDRAQRFLRHDAMVLAAAQALGQSEAQMDALWALGKSL